MMGDGAFSPALRPLADVGGTGVTLTGPDDDAAGNPPEGVGSPPAGACDVLDGDAHEAHTANRLEGQGWVLRRGAWRR